MFGLWNRKKEKRLRDLESKYLQSVDDRGWTRIFDWIPNAFQTHDPYDSEESVLAYPAVFSCSSLIQGDVGKLRPLFQQQKDGIWVEKKHKYSGLLRKPNSYQNHIKIKEAWLNSKLHHGNTYVLKVRDRNGDVAEMHILDPLKVTPLVAENGDVFYRLNEDNLVPFDGVRFFEGDKEGQVVVPASEIIHDRFNCFYHPLVGLSPLFACAQSASMGLNIVKNSKNFFKNGSNPGGILTAPGSISNDTAQRLKEYWQSNFTGDKSGKIAALGDGLEYKPLRMSNIDAQLIEHFGWTAETVCATFHVPSFLAGFGQASSADPEKDIIRYYTQCLQTHIESMEAAIDEGLEIEDGWRCHLDIDGLFRLDQGSLIKNLTDGLKGVYKPDEARRRLNLKKVDGGDAVYLQQQNYSLAALAKRDAKEDPFGKNEPAAPAPTEPTEEELEDQANYLAWRIAKELDTSEYTRT